ncbi:hypothetical protein PHPALM_28222 [Phytophthora palmivora]|uniref:Protein Lines N-terminal domain-containing protein n=1 Tax=Phytophthora palmivora TaxID=4796 RepID=A0A2P4XAP2_9STRA|nr:hypothetical protein PHPALM_28222 [Phytophthora palmivora]
MDLLMVLEYTAPDQSGVLSSIMSIMIGKDLHPFKIARCDWWKNGIDTMDWCMAIRQLEECSVATRGRCVDNLKTLLAFLDHEDVMVAYATKEKLWKVLSSGRTAETNALVTSSAAWRREASGFRLQLLRQLSTVKDEREGDSDEKEDQSRCIEEFPYLEAVVENLKQVGTMVRSILTPERRFEEDDECLTTESAPYSVHLEVEWRSQVELSEQMIFFVEEVFVAMDYESQSKFVTCAVLELVGNFQGLMKVWKDQSQDDEDDSLTIVYSKWIEKCLVWLMRSSCTNSALRLLNGMGSSIVASEEAFISQSSRYPFLQQWMLCISRVGVACLESSHIMEKCAVKELQVPYLPEGTKLWSQLQLPSRQQLFEVLTEQDDVMIEVLNGLTLMTALLDGTTNFLSHWYPAFTAHMTTEYDPDLLFAELVDTLGRDHLVVLDLLVSNETIMLEYVMRYLRRLGTHWKFSVQKLQTVERLEVVMSVLIRLRLEIDRLVASDLFPYSAGPLTRRLLAIERLYEERGDDVGQL